MNLLSVNVNRMCIINRMRIVGAHWCTPPPHFLLKHMDTIFPHLTIQTHPAQISRLHSLSSSLTPCSLPEEKEVDFGRRDQNDERMEEHQRPQQRQV